MKKSQSGVSLIEILFSIAILSVILVIATTYFGSLNQRSILVTQASEQIQQLASVGYEWKSAQSQTDFNGISLSALQQAGLLDNSDSYSQKSPWGGDISLSADSQDPNYLQISMNKIPKTECANLSNRLSNIAHRQSDNSDCSRGIYFIVL
jgi:prepilin-type N-terminal cleavage/methylation domain-containing protein